MNYWNNSATINPYGYDRGPKHEVIVLHCMACGQRAKKDLPHSTSDTAIMTKHFVGWTAKGYDGQTRTLCPECVAKVSGAIA